MSQSVLEAFGEFRSALPDKTRLYVAGCSGEPVALATALKAQPDLAAGVTFQGIWIPGINTTDWTGLNASARADTIFLQAAYRASFEAGRTDYRPLHYSDAYRELATGARLDGGVVMVSPPDAQGHVSLGLSADFSDTLIDRDDLPLMAIINTHMPAPADAPRVLLERFAVVAHDDTPLVTLEPANLPPAFASIGTHIAGLIGAAPAHVQFGLGNVQQAVLSTLAQTQGPPVRIHSGMVSDPVLQLLDSGRIPDTPGSIVTGVALGTPALYQRAANDARFSFRPVGHTHALSTLAGLERFVAVNSVMEVDLFGQANAEFMGGRQASGIGGLVDFLRGAAASPGGLPIVALPSTARRGTLSRIVPRLSPDATSITRTDIHWVVTEHGAVNLHGLNVEDRARSLISIADPAFRDDLSAAWTDMRSQM